MYSVRRAFTDAAVQKRGASGMSRRNASASVRGGNPRTEGPGPSVRRRRRGYDADTRGPRLENESFFHTNGGAIVPDGATQSSKDSFLSSRSHGENCSCTDAVPEPLGCGSIYHWRVWRRHVIGSWMVRPEAGSRKK